MDLPRQSRLFSFVVRLIPVIFFRYGYIHPDEYFQSFEVAAGDIFDLKVYRSWEFNATHPVRSILPVYLMNGPPMLIVELISKYFPSYNLGNLIFIASRCWMLCLSFTIDSNLYETLKATYRPKECKRSALNCIWLYKLSCVLLVFGVRPFSNTLELVLYAWLIKLTVSEKSDFNENLLPLSINVATGFFTRPTFLIFAFIPLLYNLAKSSNFKINLILRNALTYLITCSLIIFFYLVVDSAYFGSLHLFPMSNFMDELNRNGIFELLQNNITITPLNFMMYNLESENLARHGLHSPATHFLVNGPLIFSALILFGYFDVVNTAFKKNSVTGHLNRDTSYILFLSWSFPLLALSLFPHQEPRFLLPLIIPLVILYSPLLMDSKFIMVALWIVPNIAVTIFFGAVHQAGVVPAILSARNGFIRSYMERGNEVSVVFWKSYMPPNSLFQIPNYETLNDLTTLQKEWKTDVVKRIPSLDIIDLAGAPEKDLLLNLEKLFVTGQKTESVCTNAGNDNTAVFLFVPGSVIRGSVGLYKNFKLELVDSFWPHFSSENPPFSPDSSFNYTQIDDPAAKDCGWLCRYLPPNVINFIDASTFKIFNVTINCRL